MVSRGLGQLQIEVVGGSATIEPVSVADAAAGREVRELSWPTDELHEIVRFDEQGRYRPLSGAKTLPGGWRVRSHANEIDAVVETIYPLATVHRSQHERGELRVVGLDEVLERQTGRYAVARQLDDDGRRIAREVLCSDCVRTPVWAGERADVAEIPCPEPCSVLVSLCREAALWQEKSPATSAIDVTVPYAAFEHEGNAIREEYLARRQAAPRDSKGLPAEQ